MSIPHLRVAVVVAALLFVLPARADVAEECVAASEGGQLKRDKGALLAAREQFLLCARDACPIVVRKDCAAWLNDVDARIPSVVLGAKDEAGNDLVDVSVSIDGQPLASRLGTRATPIDPGDHVFRFEWKDGAPAETRLLAREGERQRPVLVVLERRTVAGVRPAPGADGSARSARSSGIPTGSWVLGGVALVGLGTYGYFVASGLSDRRHLERTCSPRCEDADVDPAREKILIGNVSLGVAAVAALAAVFVYLAGRSTAKAP